LDAKEVAKDVKAEATTAASKTQNFGRPEKSEPGTSEKTSDTKTKQKRKSLSIKKLKQSPPLLHPKKQLQQHLSLKNHLVLFLEN